MTATFEELTDFVKKEGLNMPNALYNSITEEQCNVLCDLYTKLLTCNSLAWSEIERSVAKILTLERSRKNE